MLHVSIKPESLFHLGFLNITNSLLTTWISIAILCLLAWLGTRGLNIKAGKSGQLIWEMVIEFFHDMVSSMSGPNKSREFFPLVVSFFLFILVMNWVGLIPGVGTIGVHHPEEESPIVNEKTIIPSEDGEEVKHEEQKLTPLFRAGTADLNTTLALAVISMVSVQYFALKHIGYKAHLHKFFNFSGPIQFFVGILELISEFAKVISFAFRLFGNIFAGEVLLAVMVFLVPIVVPLPFLGLEIFVGLIQAFVFAMLTLVFLVLATEKQHH